MKTLEQIKSQFKSKTLDGRDLYRLAQFISQDQLKDFGLEEVEDHKHIEFTKENILKQLRGDIDFGFEKALSQRGISSSLMFEVVRMWNWILEEGLEDWPDSDYAMYGLPLFKATALKYGFPNEIGDDVGSESHYNA